MRAFAYQVCFATATPRPARSRPGEPTETRRTIGEAGGTLGAGACRTRRGRPRPAHHRGIDVSWRSQHDRTPGENSRPVAEFNLFLARGDMWTGAVVPTSDGAMLITADHGNAEMMIDPATGGPHTAHTTNSVPFIVVTEDADRLALRSEGSLQDISPTVLGMLGFDQPKEMTGKDLRVVKSGP